MSVLEEEGRKAKSMAKWSMTTQQLGADMTPSIAMPAGAPLTAPNPMARPRELAGIVLAAPALLFWAAWFVVECSWEFAKEARKK